MNISLLIETAIEFDKGDARRIQHFLKVHQFATLIGTLEKLPPQEQEILEAAAVLHDIGIHAAEEKHGSSAGKYQEIEGPAIARHILNTFNCAPSFIERVCFLIGHHHTYTKVDGLDYQILLEADFLVNAYEDQLSSAGIQAAAQQFFKTKSGTALLKTIYGI
jgi:HD superfamily phosphodiesterase